MSKLTRARALSMAACALPAALVLGSALPAAAGGPAPQTTYFPQNATINYALNGNAVVGYADGADENNQTNGTSPTVSLADGGSVNTITTFNASTLNMSGGTAYRVLANSYPSDDSTVNISGGTVTFLVAAVGGGAVNISGGSFDLTARRQSSPSARSSAQRRITSAAARSAAASPPTRTTAR